MKKWSSILVTLGLTLALLLPASTVSAQDPASLSVTKTPDKNPASLGDNITYTYTITNTGPVTVDNITLTDDKLGTITLDKTTLASGETANSTGTYTHIVVIGDFPGPVTNTATANGTDPDTNPVTASTSASVTLNSYTASLSLTKTADKTSASPTENITYTYTITNTGQVTVDNITLADSKLGAVSVVTTTLAPGAITTATSTYTVAAVDLPGPLTNIATVTGTDPLGSLITATSNTVSVSLTLNRDLIPKDQLLGLTKFQILKASGVPGKGLAKAPGLQKPFNPKSKAAFRAGKKPKDK